MPKTNAFVCALYQARNIGQYKTAAFCNTHNPQHRCKGCKMISGNLRFSSGNHGNNTGFSDTRIADQTNIRQQFQFQLQSTRFTRLAFFGKGRRSMHAIDKAGISPAATASSRHNGLLTILSKISNNLAGFFISYQRSRRNLNIERLRRCTMHILRLSVCTIIGRKFAFIAKIN
ncbi:hypothetical protein SDC9_206130 [bioreactor metagenome]|uniref:Uncharacterized protein n=1 Tax=bioreactor metagenome TaxID=1076179 RepID=A0A645J3Y5_9ZZZZ